MLSLRAMVGGLRLRIYCSDGEIGALTSLVLRLIGLYGLPIELRLACCALFVKPRFEVGNGGAARFLAIKAFLAINALAALEGATSPSETSGSVVLFFLMGAFFFVNF